MVAPSIYLVILVSLSFLINECVGLNYRFLQDVPKIDAITDRLASAVAQLGKTHFRSNVCVIFIVPSKEERFVIRNILDRLINHMSRFFPYLTFAHIPGDVVDDLKSPFLHTSNVNTEQKPNICVIPIKEESELESLDNALRSFILFPSFNPRGIFILIKTIVECGSFDHYNVSSRFFAQLWKRNCMTVVLLVFSECDFRLTVVTGTPYSKENPCRVPEAGGLRYKHFISSDLLIEIDVSNTKVRDFKGCSFTAGIIPAPPFVVARQVQSGSETQYHFVGGLELDIKDMITKKFNVTVNLDSSNGYEVQSLQRIFPNGTHVGISADMKNHKIDFALGGVSPNFRTHFLYDFSHTYKFSSISWYVTDAHIAPRWQIIFKTLSLDVWIVSAGFLLLVSVLYFLMELHNYKSRKTSTLTLSSITFIELVCVGLGLPATQQPRGCLKVLYFSWAAFGLHWSMAYSSTLFDLLRTPPLDKEILTIQDLHDSKLKVVSPDLYFQLFKGVDIDRVTRSVLDNNINCKNLNLCIKQFVVHRNVSLMDRSEHFDYSVNLKLSKVHKLSENLISFGVSLMTNKGNPLFPVLNEVVLQAFETGLVSRWETETAWKFNYEKNVETYSNDDTTPQALSVAVLQGAFLLLFVGLLISLLVFLGEILMYHCQK